VSQSIFGGKIDNDFDQKILLSLTTYFFKKEAFNLDYPLFAEVEGEESQPLTCPEYRGYKEYFDWVKNLPNVESPAWSGLPLNVEKLTSIKQAELLIIDSKLM